MNKPGLRFILLIVFMIIISLQFGYALTFEFQADSARIHLSAQDQKKLASAREYEEKAIKTLQDCGELSRNISTTTPDTGIHNETYSTKCRRKRLSALDLYFSANDLRNQVYRSNIKEFLKNFPGNKDQLMKGRLLDEQSLEYLNRSSDLKKSAERKLNETEKLNLLEQAWALESRGIELEKEAWDYYSRWPESETNKSDQPIPSGKKVPFVETSPQTNANKSLLVIDTTMINRLRLFPDSSLSNGPYAFRNSTVSLKSYNTDDIRSSWYSYLDTKLPTYTNTQDSILQASNETSVTSGSITTRNDISSSSTSRSDSVLKVKNNSGNRLSISKGKDQGIVDKKGSHLADSSKLVVQKTVPSDRFRTDTSKTIPAGVDHSENTGKINPSVASVGNNPVTGKSIDETSEKGTGKGTGEKITYRVQIAANPTLLTQGTLRKLYNGNKQIEVISEDGWNKYSIGDFDSFEEADNFRNQCGVKGAFVVVYKGEKKVPFDKALAETRKSGSTVPETNIETSTLQFAVQIAASREALSDSKLRSLYPGGQPVVKHFEDDWYKYTIGKETTLLEAQRLKNECGVKGAFIVAYKDGVRISLSGLAVTHENPQEKIQKSSADKEFKVQIAASRSPLSKREIKARYSGAEEVTLQQEEGWYRYTIGNETSYANASDLKARLNIKNAFIVIYSNGKRIFPETSGNAPATISIIPGIIPATGQVYFVQLTASRSKLTVSQLTFMNESGTLMEFYEDGWYKYRINCGSNLSKAREIRKKYSDIGAFIVSFKDGTKTVISSSSDNTDKTNN